MADCLDQSVAEALLVEAPGSSLRVRRLKLHMNIMKGKSQGRAKLG